MSHQIKNASAKRNMLRFSRIIGGLVVAAAILWGISTSLQSPLPATTAGSANGVGTEPSTLLPAPIIGHPAPEFTLTTLDGQTVSLSDFHGKPIILNFWASWCGPCRLEMPHLQEAYSRHGADMPILGINLTNREGKLEGVESFLDEFGVTFPVVLDADGEVAALYEVRGQPASVFIDADGTVQTIFYGPINQQFINEQINELLES